MSVKKVIVATLLSQLLVDVIDEIEDEHAELFRHGFKQKSKAFIDESTKLFKTVISPLSDEKQVEIRRLSTEIENVMKELIDQINTDR